MKSSIAIIFFSVLNTVSFAQDYYDKNGVLNIFTNAEYRSSQKSLYSGLRDIYWQFKIDSGKIYADVGWDYDISGGPMLNLKIIAAIDGTVYDNCDVARDAKIFYTDDQDGIQYVALGALPVCGRHVVTPPWPGLHEHFIYLKFLNGNYILFFPD